MARHEVIKHENTSATKTVAPYLGNYIAKETLAMAAFDPERNTLELALRLDDAIQLDLSDTVPVIVTDENVTKLRVDNAMDLVEERPMNLIHGQHVFRVAGFNMVLTDEGATAYLEDARGTTYPLVVDEVVSKQLFKAHTAELLPGGDYKLVVKSRAGDAGGPLQTSFRKVKYLHVVDPAPASLAQTSDGKCKIMSFTDNGGATNFSFGDDWTLTGEGLYGNEAPEGEWSFDYATFHVAAEDLTFQGTFEEDGSSATLTPLPDQHITPGVYENVAFNYRVVRDGVTETLTLTIPTLTVT